MPWEADPGQRAQLLFGLATLVAVLLHPLGGFTGLATMSHPLMAVLVPVGTILAGTRLVWTALQRAMIRRIESAVLDLGTVAGESGRVTPEAGEGRFERSG